MKICRYINTLDSMIWLFLFLRFCYYLGPPLYLHLHISLLIYTITFFISSSVSVASNDTMASENPAETPPFFITPNKNSSVRSERISLFVKSRGLTPSPSESASGPSPLPRSEEHTSELQSQ